MVDAILTALIDVLLMFCLGCGIVWVVVKLIAKFNGNPDDVHLVERQSPRPTAELRSWMGL